MHYPFPTTTFDTHTRVCVGSRTPAGHTLPSRCGRKTTIQPRCSSSSTRVERMQCSHTHTTRTHTPTAAAASPTTLRLFLVRARWQRLLRWLRWWWWWCLCPRSGRCRCHSVAIGCRRCARLCSHRARACMIICTRRARVCVRSTPPSLMMMMMMMINIHEGRTRCGPARPGPYVCRACVFVFNIHGIACFARA